jgi:hypothetical protein
VHISPRRVPAKVFQVIYGGLKANGGRQIDAPATIPNPAPSPHTRPQSIATSSCPNSCCIVLGEMRYDDWITRDGKTHGREGERDKHNDGDEPAGARPSNELMRDSKPTGGDRNALV